MDPKGRGAFFPGQASRMPVTPPKAGAVGFMKAFLEHAANLGLAPPSDPCNNAHSSGFSLGKPRLRPGQQEKPLFTASRPGVCIPSEAHQSGYRY